jgi:hypothetical protein
MRILDLHNLRFKEGKDKIIEILNECLLSKETKIQIIHGYHGHIFKDYLRSSKFISDMVESGIMIKRNQKKSNPGITEFTLSNVLKDNHINKKDEESQVQPFNRILLNDNIINLRNEIKLKKKISLEEARSLFANEN